MITTQVFVVYLPEIRQKDLVTTVKNFTKEMNSTHQRSQKAPNGYENPNGYLKGIITSNISKCTPQSREDSQF